MHHDYDYIIIGAGIIGLATSYRLASVQRHARIALIDKERSVAAHQSGHNSGVVHAGVYYPPASLKAQFCRDGVTATFDFCAAHNVPARQCGKLIVATNRNEVSRLRTLAARAEVNGLECVWLEAAELARREPHIVGLAALYVAATGIADYAAICEKLATLTAALGVDLHLGEAVSAINESAGDVTIATTGRSLSCARLIVCGGLQADRLARMAKINIDFIVLPFRGDFYRLPPARSGLVSSLIYPVPNPSLPFLGVHLTLTTDGALVLGPTAMLAFARERYKKWALDYRDFVDATTYPGTWRLLKRFPRAGLIELAHASSRRLYLRAAQRYCPQLTLADLAEHTCGIRAQVVNRNGEMLNDFLIEQTRRTLHVLNAPSPAATAAFPIAERIVDLVMQRAE